MPLLADTAREAFSDPVKREKMAVQFIQMQGSKEFSPAQQEVFVNILNKCLVTEGGSGVQNVSTDGELFPAATRSVATEIVKRSMPTDSAEQKVMLKMLDDIAANKEARGVAQKAAEEAKQAATEVVKERGQKMVDDVIKSTGMTAKDLKTCMSPEASVDDRLQAGRRVVENVLKKTDTQVHRSIELDQTILANCQKILHELKIDNDAIYQVYSHAQQRPRDIKNVNVANCVRILCNAKNDFEGQKLLLDLFIRKLEQYSSEDVEQRPVAKAKVDKAAGANQQSILGLIVTGATTGIAGAAAYTKREKIKKGFKEAISWALKKTAQVLLRCMRDNPKLAIVITALIMYQLKQMAAVIQSLALFSLHSGAGHIAFMYIVSTVVIPAVIERIKRNVMTAFAISIMVVVIVFAWKYKDQLKDQASKAARSLMVKQAKKRLGLGAHANRESVILRQNKAIRDNETNQNCSAGPGRLTMRACRFQSNC